MKQLLVAIQASARSLTMILLLAVMMSIGSERIFWFWSPGLLDHLAISGFYMIATAAAVLLIRRYRIDSWSSVLLVCPVLALMVEGVLTPVVYSGGPFVPFFPAWFTMWHGVLAFVVMVLLTRRWLLDRAMARLTVSAASIGGFWAVWASTLRLPENAEDEELLEHVESLAVLGPLDFSIYAVTFTGVFMAGHLLVGHVWPERRRARAQYRGLTAGEWLVAALSLSMVAGWSIVVPWALPMFVGYAWIQVKGLRWHRASLGPDCEETSDIIDQLVGRVTARSVLPLALIAPTAACGYAALWWVDPSELVLRIAMYSIISAQALAGLVIAVRALRSAKRRATAMYRAAVPVGR